MTWPTHIYSVHVAAIVKLLKVSGSWADFQLRQLDQKSLDFNFFCVGTPKHSLSRNQLSNRSGCVQQRDDMTQKLVDSNPRLFCDLSQTIAANVLRICRDLRPSNLISKAVLR